MWLSNPSNETGKQQKARLLQRASQISADSQLTKSWPTLGIRQRQRGIYQTACAHLRPDEACADGWISE